LPLVPISDLDDPRIAVYRSLKASNRTRDLDQFVVEGARLVDRLLASRFETVSILTTDRFEARFETELSPDVPVYVLPFELIHELVGFPFHRGVLASGRRSPWPGCQELLGEESDPVTLAVCPRIGNPENLGAIARISDVFGIHAILAGPSCPDPFSRRVLRVSMGSALRLPVIVSANLEALADRLAAGSGLEFWAAVAEPSATPFQALHRPPRLALVLGDEDQGVDAAWLHRCRRCVTIPMRPGAGSLNVAVAAGILLHHLGRVGVELHRRY
jgi:tRNA G18 (ribose-2'-O)-methylase SpoU